MNRDLIQRNVLQGLEEPRQDICEVLKNGMRGLDAKGVVLAYLPLVLEVVVDLMRNVQVVGFSEGLLEIKLLVEVLLPQVLQEFHVALFQDDPKLALALQDDADPRAHEAAPHAKLWVLGVLRKQLRVDLVDNLLVGHHQGLQLEEGVAIGLPIVDVFEQHIGGVLGILLSEGLKIGT